MALLNNQVVVSQDMPKSSLNKPEDISLRSQIHDLVGGFKFQTCYIFHFIYGIIHPIDFDIFQDG